MISYILYFLLFESFKMWKIKKFPDTHILCEFGDFVVKNPYVLSILAAMIFFKNQFLVPSK